MLATSLVWMAFAASLVAAYSYYKSATGKKRLVDLARKSFMAMAAAVLAASALLMFYILRHHFEYAYVWSYSSRSLPTHLLITTFWAGQEGSFMFWALCSTIIGFALLNYTRRKRIEYETMAVFSLLQAFLLLLLIAKSPFKYVWDEFPTQLSVGTIPMDGRGLNPLLQNIWMIIHPPVLFIGFAAMAVPFALALGALWRRSYSDWILNAFPWALFSAIALGAGLMLGGYWAYGVLGWGGWWGWDPVENSSLVPWIVAVMLVHTMVVQKKTGKLPRTNFALAIAGFVLVIYSTFLTRSGILGDSSVHSFVDPGAFAYTLLILWMITVTGLGFLMLASRWSELRKNVQSVGIITRESLISIGAAVMGASAVVILFGTSWPLIAKSTVEPSFYDSMNLPIAVLMGLGIGVSLLVQWRMESLAGLFRRAMISLAVTAAGTIFLFFAGVRETSTLALSAASLFALAVTSKRAYNLGRQNPRLLGGVLSHAGLAILFLAIIASGRYGEKQIISLPLNQPQEVFGYSVLYSGATPLEGGKQQFSVKVNRNGSEFTLDPVMYESSYNNSLMREPDYASSITRDFYIEPVSLETQPAAAGTSAAGTSVRLSKGVSQKVGDATLTFLRFDMNAHDTERMTGNQKGFVVGAVVSIKRGGKTEEKTLLATFAQGSEPAPVPLELAGSKIRLSFVGMNVGMDTKQSTIDVVIDDSGTSATPSAATKEVLVVEASLKPFMSFVWIAALLVLAGMTLALQQHLSSQLIRPDKRRSNGHDQRGNHSAVPPQKHEALIEQPTYQRKG